jgi:hypothetical protein
MNRKKKDNGLNEMILGLVMTVLFIVFGYYNIADAQKQIPIKKEVVQKEVIDSREVSIFGVTLGKSLNDLAIKECKIKTEERFGSGSVLKTYEKTQESICWKDWSPDIDDRKVDFLRLGSNSAAAIFSCGKCIIFRVNYLEKAKQNELLSYPVAEINMGFPYEMSEVFLKLVVNKFGKPNKVEKSILQNKMGATFDNETYYWDVGQHRLILHKRYMEVEAGLFTATHYDKWSKDTGELMKKIGEAEKKF